MSRGQSMFTARVSARFAQFSTTKTISSIAPFDNTENAFQKFTHLNYQTFWEHLLRHSFTHTTKLYQTMIAWL